ncbi:MAG: aldose epimerase family protein [Planctomycetaceae bacterium]
MRAAVRRQPLDSGGKPATESLNNVAGRPAFHWRRLAALTLVVVVCGALPGLTNSSRGEEPAARRQASACEQLALAAFDAQKGFTVVSKSFGKTPEGIETHLFTITNPTGASLQLTDYGARIVAVNVPDRAGKSGNVTLGLDSVEKYLAHIAFFGCTTGRFANRIAKGRFSLDGREYKLAINNGPNHLHGGLKGFDKVVWKTEEVSQTGAAGVKFTYKSPDGDEGYPGTLDTAVTIWLTADNAVRLDYLATTDKPTIVNLTNHAYWNLAGYPPGAGTVYKHKLYVAADQFLEVDGDVIPTGKLLPVSGTPLDFTSPQEVGSRIEQFKSGDQAYGYDHCYVLRNKSGELTLAARVEEPESGRVMEVLTTEPAVQFFTSNFFDGGPQMGGYKRHAALCLETQHYPDAPNQAAFPSVILRPGQTFKSSTVYRFSVKP